MHTRHIIVIHTAITVKIKMIVIHLCKTDDLQCFKNKIQIKCLFADLTDYFAFENKSKYIRVRQQKQRIFKISSCEKQTRCNHNLHP